MKKFVIDHKFKHLKYFKFIIKFIFLKSNYKKNNNWIGLFWTFPSKINYCFDKSNLLRYLTSSYHNVKDDNSHLSNLKFFSVFNIKGEINSQIKKNYSFILVKEKNLGKEKPIKRPANSKIKGKDFLILDNRQNLT